MTGSSRRPPGRPFPKGVSGNPHGRPPTGLAFAEQARELVTKHELVEKLAAIATRTGRGVRVVDQLKAIQLVLAYAYGTPKSEVALQHSGSIDRALDLSWFRAVVVPLVPEEVRPEVARRLMELDKENGDGESEPL